ncbi:hypothetical protein [Puniceibacterium sediminis]|uniref:Uncharacterized protein n=1 Tax=Puniceibacterium sediminis TaxID=1608407 RepID=A0A238WEH2_9RHOB|nr:hypothetical protein [Puniceibacterium sediminis]SNR44751.1 hypothetical protein SAMN06265370_105143 [Puniceibacterium sediminis]
MTPKFPETVLREVETYLGELSEGRPYGGLASKHRRAALSPRTTKSIKEQLDWYFTALVETDDNASLLERLKDREADRDRLQSALTQALAAAPAASRPSVSGLASSYTAQVARLDTLLTGSDCLIEANMLLRALLGTVAVAPDAEARDGTGCGLVILPESKGLHK